MNRAVKLKGLWNLKIAEAQKTLYYETKQMFFIAYGFFLNFIPAMAAQALALELYPDD